MSCCEHANRTFSLRLLQRSSVFDSVAFNYIRRRNLLEVALVRTATASADPAVLAPSSGAKSSDLSDINPESGWPGSLPIRVQVRSHRHGGSSRGCTCRAAGTVVDMSPKGAEGWKQILPFKPQKPSLFRSFTVIFL